MPVTSLWLAHGIPYVHEALLLVGFCNANWRIFGVPCDSPAVAVQVSVWYIHTYAIHSWYKKCHCKLKLKRPVMGVLHGKKKKLQTHKKFFNIRFHFRHGKNLQKTFTDWRKVDRICGKWGYSQENFGTACTGVGSSFPQNVTKVLDFHLHKTTVIHKVCNAICEARPNFMN